MGRHRRSGATPAEADYATGADRGHGGARRKRRPVRTGLIGASAGVAPERRWRPIGLPP